METTHVMDGTRSTVRLSGRLDFSRIPVLCQAVDGALARHDGMTHLHLDLHDLHYLDSAGLGHVIQLHRQLAPAVSLEIHRPRGIVQQILTMMHAHRVLSIVD